ncbi:MAG: thiosulfate oxidation carrier complex protein SoxZ [Pseudomonadota bacterium]
MDNIKIRAKLVNDTTEVKMIINHPMETGRKKDDFGQLIPAHFIQLLTAKLNDKPVMEMQWGTGISKNPYLTFYLKDAKIGDKIAVNWVDNLGKTGEGDVLVTAG